MQLLSAFFLPLAVSLLLGCLVCLAGGQPFGRAMPAAYLGAGVLLYLGTLFTGRFTAGCLLVLAAALAGAVLLALRARRGLPALAQTLCTPGLWAFLLLYLFVFALHTGRAFAWWDEYSHWGPMVKEMLRLDAFYSVPASALGIHKDYPPFFPLLEAAWCRLCGGYGEASLYRCLLTVQLSLFLPMFEAPAPRPLPRAARAVQVAGGCALVVLGCSVICGDIPFFTSVYLDYPLALLLAYALSCVALEDAPHPFTGVCLALAGTALLLTKQMGLAFYLMPAGLLTACCLRQLIPARPGERRALLARQAAVWLPAVCVPPLFGLSWSRYTAALEAGGQFSAGDMQPALLPGILRGTAGEPYQQETAQNFINAFFHKNIWAAGAGKIELAYSHIALLFALALAVLTALAVWQGFDLIRMLLLDAVLLGGSLCYALAMLLSYLSGFSEYEATHLASYSRYMNTYWFAAAAVIIMLFYAALRRMQPRLMFSLGGAALLLIAAELFWEQRGNLRNLLPRPDDPSSPSVVYRADAAILTANTPERARVFIVDQASDGFSTHALRYLASPRGVNQDDFSVGAPYYEGDVWTKNRTPQEYADLLEGYDYLYFVYVDGPFIERYGALLPDSPNAGALYRVAGAEPLVLERVPHD